MLLVGPNELHMVAEIDSIRAPQILGLLTVVLWSQKPQGAGGHLISVLDFEHMASAGVVQNGPFHSANPGGAGCAVKSLDPNIRLGRWNNKVREVVGDASGCAAVHQDIEGVRIKNGTVGYGWT